MFSSKLNGTSTLIVLQNTHQNIFLTLTVQKLRDKVKFRNNLKFIFCIAVFTLKSLLMSFHRMGSQQKDTNLMALLGIWRVCVRSLTLISRNGLKNRMFQTLRSTRKYWTAFLRDLLITLIGTKKMSRIIAFWLKRFWTFHLLITLRREELKTRGIRR